MGDKKDKCMYEDGKCKPKAVDCGKIIPQKDCEDQKDKCMFEGGKCKPKAVDCGKIVPQKDCEDQKDKCVFEGGKCKPKEDVCPDIKDKPICNGKKEKCIWNDTKKVCEETMKEKITKALKRLLDLLKRKINEAKRIRRSPRRGEKTEGQNQAQV